MCVQNSRCSKKWINRHIERGTRATNATNTKAQDVRTSVRCVCFHVRNFAPDVLRESIYVMDSIRFDLEGTHTPCRWRWSKLTFRSDYENGRQLMVSHIYTHLCVKCWHKICLQLKRLCVRECVFLSTSFLCSLSSSLSVSPVRCVYNRRSRTHTYLLSYTLALTLSAALRFMISLCSLCVHDCMALCTYVYVCFKCKEKRRIFFFFLSYGVSVRNERVNEWMSVICINLSKISLDVLIYKHKEETDTQTHDALIQAPALHS